MEPALIDDLMQLALAEARAAEAHDDIPIGAVVARISDGTVLARRHNEREQNADPTAHAEVLALRDAAEAVGSWRLTDCVLVTTLEPCVMCAGASLNARIGLVVFGADDPKAGAVGSRYHVLADPRLNHECDVVHGVRADESAELLQTFFSTRRG
jgi:tRNA(adenine34) deaminase